MLAVFSSNQSIPKIAKCSNFYLGIERYSILRFMTICFILNHLSVKHFNKMILNVQDYSKFNTRHRQFVLLTLTNCTRVVSTHSRLPQLHNILFIATTNMAWNGGRQIQVEPDVSDKSWKFQFKAVDLYKERTNNDFHNAICTTER